MSEIAKLVRLILISKGLRVSAAAPAPIAIAPGTISQVAIAVHPRNWIATPAPMSEVPKPTLATATGMSRPSSRASPVAMTKSPTLISETPRLTTASDVCDDGRIKKAIPPMIADTPRPTLAIPSHLARASGKATAAPMAMTTPADEPSGEYRGPCQDKRQQRNACPNERDPQTDAGHNEKHGPMQQESDS